MGQAEMLHMILGFVVGVVFTVIAFVVLAGATEEE